jgi:cellulose synthase (UDP-forming)
MNRQRLLNLGFVGVAVLMTLAAAWMKGREGIEGLLWGSRTVLGGTWLLAETDHVNLGVYDPDGALAGSDRVALDHVFVSWVDFDAAQMRRKFDQARALGRWLMVTVEPWPRDRALGSATLLPDIAAGRYDVEIDAVCAALGAFRFPLFVRWGHEMETPTGRYPWAQSDPALYIAAYRHFVTRCRAGIGESYFVWSPRGDDGVDNYFPGRDYAAHVGVSVYALPALDIAAYGRTRSFAENFGEKYDRVKKHALPVMIAELGVAGTTRYRRIWFDDLRRSLARFPLLKTIVLFNALEPEGVYPPEYGRPDWRIDPTLLD